MGSRFPFGTLRYPYEWIDGSPWLTTKSSGNEQYLLVTGRPIPIFLNLRPKRKMLEVAKSILHEY